jgi:hypothetical protein
MGNRKRTNSQQKPAASASSPAARSAAPGKKQAKCGNTTAMVASASTTAAPLLTREDDATAVSSLKQLACAVIKDRKQVNNMVALLRYTQEDQYSDEVLFHALQWLDRVWLHLLESDPSFLTEVGQPGDTSSTVASSSSAFPSSSSSSSSAAAVGKERKRKRTNSSSNSSSGRGASEAVENSRQQLYQWLRRQYSNYCNRLNTLVFHEQPAVQLICVRNLMQAVRLMSNLSAASRANAAALFSQFMQSLINPPPSVVDSEQLVDEVSDDALDELCTVYLSSFPDLLHRCFVSVRKVLQRCKRTSREKAIRDRAAQVTQAEHATTKQAGDKETQTESATEKDGQVAALVTERELAQKLLATRAYLLLRLLPNPATSLRCADQPFFLPLQAESAGGETDESTQTAADRKREKRKRKRGKKLTQTAELPDDITLRRSFRWVVCGGRRCVKCGQLCELDIV